MNNIYKSAFTLAEVLITLSIIGIIAAMTLPALINKTNNAENVVALKKAYEVLSSAYLKVYNENGAIAGRFNTSADFINAFATKMNVQKNCGYNDTDNTGCFPNISYKYPNGTTITDTWGNYTTGGWHTIHLNYNEKYAFSIWHNGPKKGPATSGRDLFEFTITPRAIYPRGGYPDKYCTVFKCSGTQGGGCAAKVLAEGAMNY